MLRTKSPQASFFGSYLYDRVVPPDHLLRNINQTVDFSFVHDLLSDRYTPDFGRPAEDPEFMLRLCLLQYLYGDSDRQVIENARLNLAYKYFLGLPVDGEVPDDTTLSHFRSVRLGEEEFRKVFEQIVRQCVDAGLVTGKRQIIDSTHIEADAARNSLAGIVRICRRNVVQDVRQQDPGVCDRLGLVEPAIRKQDRFARVEEGLEEELAQARTVLDEVTAGLEQGGLRPTPELVRSLEVLEKAVADREDRVGDRLASPIDRDARIGRKESKTWTGYKGHLLVEEESEIITAVETTPANTDDGGLLEPLLEQQEDALTIKPQELSADKAYGRGANLDLLESKGITGYISLKERQNTRGSEFTLDDFKRDTISGTLTCPAGQVASHSRKDLILGERGRRKGIVFQFRRLQCTGCTLKIRCHPTTGKVRGRSIHISVYEPYYQQMRERMASETGREAYRNRYRVEHKIADLARYCGMRHCRYRGLARAKVHTLLAAMVSNVKRMARLLWKPPGPSLNQPAMAT
jgi:transposase